MSNTLAYSITQKELIKEKTLVAILAVACAVIFTTLGAYVYIPLFFTPVPITLQTFFVFLSAAVLGKRLGTISQLAYIIFGAIGLPVFLSGSFGLMYISGPTGGYIIGFIFAAYVIGKMLQNSLSFISLISALVCAEIIILSMGAAWLCIGLRFSPIQAFYLGLLPFIPGDMVKIIAAAIIVKPYLKRSRSLFYQDQRT
jgi:biotin transport system substrate-specific component